jgi:hypothetical protein
MRYEDLRDDVERDIWREEVAALRGFDGAEGWAAHAIEVHRQSYGVPLENAKIRRRTMSAKRGFADGRELRALASRCLRAGRVDVAVPPRHSRIRNWRLRSGMIRAYAMTAMQMLVGTPLTAITLGLSGQGVRNRSVYLRTDHPAVADRVRAFVAAVQAERLREGKAA